MHPHRAGTLLRLLVCCIAADEQAARELGRRLQLERMVPRLSLDGPLGAALAECDAAILCLSPRALEGGRLAAPLATAFDLTRRSHNGQRRLLVGLKLEPCELPADPEGLTIIEFYAPRGYERLMRALWRHVAALRHHSRPPAATPVDDKTFTPVAQQTSRSLELPVTPHFAVSHPELERRQALRLGNGVAGPAWWLANGRVLAVAAGGARLLDPAGGATLGTIDCPAACAALSADRRTLALGAGSHVMLWELEHGTLQATYNGRPRHLSCLAFHPQGLLLAAGTHDGMLLIWRIEQHGTTWSQPIATLHAHSGRLNCVAFSPDGSLLASGSADRSVRLWRTLDRGLVRTLHEQGAVEALAFSPDGTRLAVGHRARAVTLWEPATGRRGPVLAAPGGAVESLCFAPDRRQLAAGLSDGTLCLWQDEAGEARLLHGPGGRISGLCFAPDGALLLAGGETTLQAWRLADGAVTARMPIFNAPVTALALEEGRLALGLRDGTLGCYSLKGEQLANLPNAGAQPVGLGFIAANELLAISAAGEVRSINLSSLQYEQTGDSMLLRFAAMHGADLALCAGEGGLELWQVAETGWRHWASIATRPRRAQQAALAPDRSLLAAILDERELAVWHLPRSRHGLPDHFRTLTDHARLHDLTFTADSGALVVAADDGAVRVWRLADGALLAAFEHEGIAATSVAITPDGQVAAAGFADGTVRLWRLVLQPQGRKAARHKPVTLSGHAGAVERLAFSPDGAILVSASSDGTARLWPL